MLIRELAFRGELPAVAPQLLPEQAAQVSRNLVRDNGNLRPLRDTAVVATPAKVGVKKSIHLFAGTTWFHWTDEVDAVRAPLAYDTQERTIFTGDGPPRVTDASIATAGGGALYPTNSYLLGIPAPLSAPAVAVQGASVKPTEAESTSYVETFVRRWSGIDEEGPPSPESVVVDVEFVNGQSVVVSALNTAPLGHNITHRRLYRYNTASGDTALQFVLELPIATTSLVDATLSENLGEVLSSEDYSPPPDGLKGIRAMPNGVLVGFVGKMLCFCEPGAMHAWPTKYRKPADFEIVGLEVFSSSVLVGTKGVPYVASGSHPGYMTMDRTEIAQACVSRRGMVDLGAAVAYPSPDGLMLLGSGVAENVTAKLFRRKDWQALKPESFLAAAHNGKYVAFYDTGSAQGCLILDLADGSVDFADIHATAVHVDLLTDQLYLQRGNDIVAWDAGSNLTLRRRGRRHDLPRPSNFGAAQVKAKAYPCTYRLYADGVLKHTQVVSSKRPFRLPGGYLAEALEQEVEGTVEIEEILAAETLVELGQV